VFQVNLILIFVHLNCCDSWRVFLLGWCVSLLSCWLRPFLRALSVVIPFVFMGLISSMQNKVLLFKVEL